MANENTIFPKGSKAPADYFTGTAWVNTLVPLGASGGYVMANVEFEPGCRNNWHTHAAGQVLLVTSGEGFYQERGKAALRLSKGDIIVIPADVEHWHGAKNNAGLVHIAVTNSNGNNVVQWLQPVTDEEYIACHT